MRYHTHVMAAPPVTSQTPWHMTPHPAALILGATLAGALLLLVASAAGGAATLAEGEVQNPPPLERVAVISDGALSGAAVFSPSEMSFAALTTDGEVRIMRPTGTVLRVLKLRGDPILSFAYAPDGNALLTGTEGGKLVLWDLRTGDRRTVAELAGVRADFVAWLTGPDRAVVGMSVPTAEASARPSVSVVDLETGKVQYTFAAAVRDGYATLCPSRDGTCLAALGIPEARGSACLLKGADGVMTSRLSHPDYPNGWLSVCISPDGKTLATGQAKDIVLWDVATGRPTGILRGHTGWVVALAFSPDGRTLASGSRDGTARVWDLSRKAALGYVAFDGAPRVRSVSFAPDGTLLIAAAWADHILARVPGK